MSDSLTPSAGAGTVLWTQTRRACAQGFDECLCHVRLSTDSDGIAAVAALRISAVSEPTNSPVKISPRGHFK
jgi:hypothetical protein